MLAELDVVTLPKRRLRMRTPPNAYPRFIYKFRRLDLSDPKAIPRTRDIIVENRLFLSSPDDFNDPFDMQCQVIAKASKDKKRQRITELVDRNMPLYSREAKQRHINILCLKSNAELAKYAQVSFNRIMGTAGVCAFADNAKHTLMWSHYADDHKGICLQFDIARDPRMFLQAISVDYEEEYPIVNWLSLDTSDNLMRVIFRKSPAWAYEEERRIMIPDRARTPINFLPASLTSVIVGCRCPLPAIDAIKTLLADRAAKGFPAVRLLTATRHASKYAIKFYRVT